MRQVVRWSDDKAGTRAQLVAELKQRCPDGRGLNDPSQISRWKKGTRYDADVLVAMISYLTERPVEDLMELLNAGSRFGIQPGPSSSITQRIRRLPGGPDVKRK